MKRFAFYLYVAEFEKLIIRTICDAEKQTELFRRRNLRTLRKLKNERVVKIFCANLYQMKLSKQLTEIIYVFNRINQIRIRIIKIKSTPFT